MTKEKCYVCEKGILKNKLVDFSMYGISLGSFPAQVCTKCGEEFFSESASDQIDEEAKKHGLWGLEADTKVTQTGSSLAVTVNKQIAQFMRLQKGKKVHLQPENRNKLVIEVI